MTLIESKIEKLVNIDKYLESLIKDGNFFKDKNKTRDFFNHIDNFIKTRDAIRKEFTRLNILKVSDQQKKNILRRISAKDDFIADFVINVFDKDSKYDWNELSDEEIDELASDALFSWIGPREYIEGIIQIGVIVTNVNLPSIFNSYLEEAKKCYAFQQYNAVNALCRIILEISIKDIYTRKGFKIKESLENSKNQSTTSLLINEISSGQLKKKLKSLYYGKLSPTIHGDESIYDKHVKIHVKETLELIEQLYDISFKNVSSI